MVFGLFRRRRRDSERSEKPRITRIVGPLSSTYREAPPTVKEPPPKDKKEKGKEKDRSKDKDACRGQPTYAAKKPRPMSMGPGSGIGPGIASTFVPPSPVPGGDEPLSSRFSVDSRNDANNSRQGGQPPVASIPISHPPPVHAGSASHTLHAPQPGSAWQGHAPPLRPSSGQGQRPPPSASSGFLRPPAQPRPRPQSMPPGAFPANFRIDAGGPSLERRRFFSNVPNDARLAAWDARNAERNRSKLPPRRDSIPLSSAARSASSSVIPPPPPFAPSPTPSRTPSPSPAPIPRFADGTPPLRLRASFTDAHFSSASGLSEGGQGQPTQPRAAHPPFSEAQGQAQLPSRLRPSFSGLPPEAQIPQPRMSAVSSEAPPLHLTGMFEAPRPAPAPPLPPGAQPAKPLGAGSAAKSRRASEATAMRPQLGLERGPSVSRRKPRPVSHYQLSSDAREASIVDSAPSIRPPSICRADDLAHARLALSPRLSLANTPGLDPHRPVAGGLAGSPSGGSSMYSTSPPSTPQGDTPSGASNGRAYAMASPRLNGSSLPASALSVPMTSPKVATPSLPPGAHPSAMSPRLDVPSMPTSLRQAHDTPWAQSRDRSFDAVSSRDPYRTVEASSTLPRHNPYRVVAVPPSTHARQPSWVA